MHNELGLSLYFSVEELVVPIFCCESGRNNVLHIRTGRNLLFANLLCIWCWKCPVKTKAVIFQCNILLYWIKYYLIRFVMILRYTYKSLLFLLTRGRFSKVCLVFVISWYNFFRSLFIYLSASRIKSYFIKILSYTIAIGFVIQCLHMLNKTNYIYIQVEQLKLIK